MSGRSAAEEPRISGQCRLRPAPERSGGGGVSGPQRSEEPVIMGAVLAQAGAGAQRR